MTRVVITRFAQECPQIVRFVFPPIDCTSPADKLVFAGWGRNSGLVNLIRQRCAKFQKKIIGGTLLDVDLLPRRAATAVQSIGAGISVNELSVAFLFHAERH